MVTLSMTGSTMIEDKTTEIPHVNDGQAKPKQADPTARKTRPIDAASPDTLAMPGRKPLFRS
jgi:hypothetical protein